MINGITPASTPRTDTARTQRTETASASASASAVGTTKAAGLAPPSLAADLVSAMGPPLDIGKIEAIRTAIAEGHYTINPVAIADRMVDTDLSAAS